MFGMLSFFGDLVAFLSALKVLLLTGMLGAIAALAGMFAGRLIGGATGIIVSAVIGAAIVGGVSATSAFKDLQDAKAQEEIRRLKAELAAKAISLDLANASKAELEKAVTEAEAVNEHNKGVLDELEAAMRYRADECGVSAEELDIIRKLQ